MTCVQCRCRHQAFGAKQKTPRGDCFQSLHENIDLDELEMYPPMVQIVYEWMSKTRRTTPFLAAISARLPKVAAWLLKNGRADPMQVGGGGPAACHDALTNPAAPKGAAAEAAASAKCKAGFKATAALLKLALGPWKPASHWLHSMPVRAAIATMLQTSERLHRTGLRGAVVATAAAAPAALTPVTAAATSPLPLLPPELWLFIFKFVQREWWGPCNVPSAGIARWPKTLADSNAPAVPAAPVQEESGLPPKVKPTDDWDYAAEVADGIEDGGLMLPWNDDHDDDHDDDDSDDAGDDRREGGRNDEDAADGV